MKFKSGPDRWSVAEVVEHMALVEDGLFQNVTNKVMKSPAGATDRDFQKTDANVLAMLPDRSSKRQAPPPFVFTGRWKPEEALDHFLRAASTRLHFWNPRPTCARMSATARSARWTPTNGCCLWEDTASALPNKSWK